jgi:UDP-N-acetylglucosamine--N-acetylmuramyl-(pentapeptide) pyrophosphoryl-undecaprenol N-acetylglucosamine transferase
MKNKPQLKILLACGGSGGHLIPGLVVRDELVKRGHIVFLSVSDKKVDTDILSKNRLEPSLVLKANTSGLPAPLRALRVIVHLLQSTLMARSFIKSQVVDFVLGMGGFNCAAPLFTAASLKIPCALHESNVIPGRATRLLRKSVDVLFVGFEQCGEHLQDAKDVRLTGTPTRYKRNDIDKKRTPENYRAHGLNPEKNTVLFMGGSQGSEFLNKILADCASLFAAHRDKIQIIHISGKTQSPLEIHPVDDLGITRKHYQFYNEMDALYALADVVVARSGSGVISEILELRKKAILIPLPTAAYNHQWHNARAVESPGVIEMLEQKDASPARLVEKILKLLKNDFPPGWKNPAPSGGPPEAVIASVIEKISEQQRKK